MRINLITLNNTIQYNQLPLKITYGNGRGKNGTTLNLWRNGPKPKLTGRVERKDWKVDIH